MSFAIHTHTKRLAGQNCIRLKLTCEGYRKNPGRFGVRPELHPKSRYRALSRDREDVEEDVESTSINVFSPHSRSPKLIQGLVPTSTPPTTWQADLCRSFGRLENLPRLPELDAAGSVIDAAEHSLFSQAADNPPQDVPQTNLTALPPLVPCDRCYSQHFPQVGASPIVQFSPLGPNRPRPIEPPVLAPTYTSQQEVSHKFLQARI